MCGVSLILSDDRSDSYVINALLQACAFSLLRRGPDSFKTQKVLHKINEDQPCGSSNEAVAVEQTLHFSGGVLHIQGESGIVEQPHIDEFGNILLWNGEVWDSADGTLSLSGRAKSGLLGICDTIIVAKLLREACDLPAEGHEDSAIAECLANIYGPFAFIYYHATSSRVFYGRDPFGRRSLLRYRGEKGVTWIASLDLLMSSTSDARVEEVPITGIYEISLAAANRERELLYPQNRVRLCRKGIFAKSCFASEVDADDAAANASMMFRRFLKEALQRRVDAVSCQHASGKDQSGHEAIPKSGARIGVLFSGGIDSVLLAALLHECLQDPSEPIDLINVTFYGETDSSGVVDDSPSPDRLASISAYVELASLYPSRKWNFVHVDVQPEERIHAEVRIKQVISPCDTHMDLNIGTAFWFAARGTGYCKEYTHIDQQNALSVENGGRPLLRIGAEGAARGVGRKLMEDVSENSTDQASPLCNDHNCNALGCRKPAKMGCSNKMCGQCCLKLFQASSAENSTLSWCCSVHNKKYRVPPNHTSADAFALKVQPAENSDIDTTASQHIEKREFSSTCRVLIVGIGADEQLAGYGRHRTTFLSGGETALAEELDMDLNRLHTRNLGRDDRCLSDHGREAWFPYLDEFLVTFLQGLSLREIANLREPSGKGDKMILRRAAKSVGLKSCTELVKRAVQVRDIACSRR